MARPRSLDFLRLLLKSLIQEEPAQSFKPILFRKSSCAGTIMASPCNHVWPWMHKCEEGTNKGQCIAMSAFLPHTTNPVIHEIPMLKSSGKTSRRNRQKAVKQSQEMTTKERGNRERMKRLPSRRDRVLGGGGGIYTLDSPWNISSWLSFGSTPGWRCVRRLYQHQDARIRWSWTFEGGIFRLNTRLYRHLNSMPLHNMNLTNWHYVQKRETLPSVRQPLIVNSVPNVRSLGAQKKVCGSAASTKRLLTSRWAIHLVPAAAVELRELICFPTKATVLNAARAEPQRHVSMWPRDIVGGAVTRGGNNHQYFTQVGR